MTEKNGQPLVKYLDVDDIKVIYSILEDRFREIGEPIPPYSLVNMSEIETLVALPQTSFYGKPQYPTLAAKATILLYKINKGHIFPNGNKRMSIACLLIFLGVNNYELDCSSDELTEKAIWLAQSDAGSFDAVKVELEAWIEEHLRVRS